jgi:hypothetical protein
MEILIYDNFALLEMLLVSTSVVDGGVGEANPVLPHVELCVVGTYDNSIYLYFWYETFITVRIICAL